MAPGTSPFLSPSCRCHTDSEAGPWAFLGSAGTAGTPKFSLWRATCNSYVGNARCQLPRAQWAALFTALLPLTVIGT